MDFYQFYLRVFNPAVTVLFAALLGAILVLIVLILFEVWKLLRAKNKAAAAAARTTERRKTPLSTGWEPYS